MMISVIPLRFGIPVTQTIAPKTRWLLQNMTSSLFSIDVSNISIETPIAIPSDNVTSKDSIADLLDQAFSKSGSTTRFLLDCGGPNYEELVGVNVIQGLLKAINRNLAAYSSNHFVIAAKHAISSSELNHVALDELVDTGHATLVFGNGDITSKDQDIIQNIGPQIAKWYKEATRNPLDRLKSKLVRHVGNFRLPGNDNHLPYFYDLSQCGSEIYEIVRDLIGEVVGGKRRICTIYYLDDGMREFVGSVEAALDHFGLLEIGRRLELDCLDDIIIEKDSILLWPFMRTGDTLRRILKNNHSLDPIVWSLLSVSEDEPDNSDNGRILVVENHGAKKHLQVQIGLSIGHDSLGFTNIWNDLELEPELPSNIDLAANWSSQAMWAMSLEAGITREEYGPDDRDRLPYIPNFGRLFELNSPLTVAKILCLLKEDFSDRLSENLVFLCPYEPAALVLERSLIEQSNDRFVSIERKVLNHCRHCTSLEQLDSAVTSDFLNLESPWTEEEKDRYHSMGNQLRQLAEIRKRTFRDPRPQAIILDEFATSGSTAVEIAKLCRWFGLQVVCYIAIAEMSDTVVEFEFPYYSFYQFGYKI